MKGDAGPGSEVPDKVVVGVAVGPELVIEVGDLEARPVRDLQRGVRQGHGVDPAGNGQHDAVVIAKARLVPVEAVHQLHQPRRFQRTPSCGPRD